MSYNNELYKDNISVENNGLVEPISSTKSTPSYIFRADNNAVLLFFIPFKDAKRKKYKDLIMEHGGIITETEPRDTNNIILLSSHPVPYRGSYKFEFIDDSVAAGTLVDISRYKVPPLESLRDINRQPKTHNRFDSVKDQYILEQVRRNPRKRNSHAFFDNLAEHEILSAHSGNSIRSRYRVHLKDKLEYVYKSNANDELVTDDDGNLIRLSVDEFPFTLKNRFTAEDDYLLSKEILKYNEEKNDDPNFDPYSQLSVPISFFGEFVRHKETKSHTINSWRDRYRKYVFKHGVKRFIDYYESCIKNNTVPKAITKPNDINVEFRNLIGSSYRPEVRDSSNDDAAESSALDEEIGQVKSSNIDHALIDQDARRRQVREQKQLQIQASQAVEAAEPAQSVESLESAQPIEIAQTVETSQPTEYSQSIDVAQPVQPVETAQTVEIAQTAQTAQTAEIVKIPQDTHHVAEAGTFEKPIDTGDKVLKDSQDGSSSEQFFDTKDESQESEITIQYAPKTTLLGEVVNENLCNYPDPNELILKLFNVMSSEESSISNFFIKFKSFGFNDVFTAHVIMCTSGDVVKIKSFMESFLKKLYSMENAEMSPEELYDFLRIKTMNGIWYEKADSLLGTKQESKLRKIHSENEIKLRKDFLKALD